MFGCFCGAPANAMQPHLQIQTAAGSWRTVQLPSGLSAIMIENLPKRWANGDDFWDKDREARLACGTLTCLLCAQGGAAEPKRRRAGDCAAASCFVCDTCRGSGGTCPSFSLVVCSSAAHSSPTRPVQAQWPSSGCALVAYVTSAPSSESVPGNGRGVDGDSPHVCVECVQQGSHSVMQPQPPLLVTGLSPAVEYGPTRCAVWVGASLGARRPLKCRVCAGR